MHKQNKPNHSRIGLKMKLSKIECCQSWNKFFRAKWILLSEFWNIRADRHCFIKTFHTRNFQNKYNSDVKSHVSDMFQENLEISMQILG